MKSLITRAAIAAGALLVAAFLAALAVAFFGVASYFALRGVPLSPAVSAVIVGAIWLLLALLLALIARGMVGRRRRYAAPATTSTDAAGVLAQTVMRDAFSLAQAHPYRTLLIS